MKWIAALLVTVSLVTGTIASTTAYTPRLDAIEVTEDADAQLTLNASAGMVVDADGVPELDGTRNRVPLYDARTKLTPKVIQALKDNAAFIDEKTGTTTVPRVRVREFSIGRWDHKLWFVLAAVGLVAGGLMIRVDQKRHLEASAAREHGTGAAASPSTLLQNAAEATDRLLADLDGTPADEQGPLIVARLDHVQAECFAPFVLARAALIGRFGMGGYAHLMDYFASAERQYNRAWSAAADEVLDESHHCLVEGHVRLNETIAVLSEKS